MAYRHLTSSERKVICALWNMGYTQKAIARILGRSQSTISRELRRNGDPGGYYNPHAGNVAYMNRRVRLYKRTKRDNEELMDLVVSWLKRKWSPEQIAGRLRHLEYPDDPSMWVSHETIYRFIHEDKLKGGNLYTNLRRGRRKYGKRGKGRHPNTFVNGRVSIEERPDIVEQRVRLGDWEADTFYGRHRKGCLSTMVERASGFLSAATMPNAKASSLNLAILRGLQGVPTALVHTVTVDNGKEFSRFGELERALQARFFFAHPYSAWERGVNENTNGLLRQYFPKKTDLSKITEEQLEEVVRCLNDRPRKRLDYRTPREVFLPASEYALDG